MVGGVVKSCGLQYGEQIRLHPLAEDKERERPVSRERGAIVLVPRQGRPFHHVASLALDSNSGQRG